MNFIFRFFTQPYPLSDSKNRKVIIAFGMGIFVFLFLFFFRPFGLYSLPSEDAPITLIGFGIICALILLFDLIVIPGILPSLFVEEHWSVWKEVIYILWNIITIGIGNFIYAGYVFRTDLNWRILLNYQMITLLVAILPVTLIVLVKQLRLMRRNLLDAKKISANMHHKKRLGIDPDLKVTIRAENPKENLVLGAMQLLFITSADNYIEVHYLDESKEQSKLLRSTLKNAKEDLRTQNAFYRCHRGWIVNLDHVHSVTGNSQGYKLKLRHSATEVPVSRNLSDELGTRLSK